MVCQKDNHLLPDGSQQQVTETTQTTETKTVDKVGGTTVLWLPNCLLLIRELNGSTAGRCAACIKCNKAPYQILK